MALHCTLWHCPGAAVLLPRNLGHANGILDDDVLFGAEIESYI